MRLMALRLAVLGAIGALSQAATAQTSECRSIAEPAARLACYDKAVTPQAAAAANAPTARASTLARPQTPAIDSTKYVDGIGDQDAAVNAKLHGICRGC
jgi:hypothetical protein